MDSSAAQPSPPDHPLEPGKPPTTLFPTEDVPATGQPGHTAPERHRPVRPAASGHEQDRSHSDTSPESRPNEQPRPAAVEHVNSERQTTANHELPEDVELVTVEEAVALFREAGLPRHIRTIQKYCARASGRALVCHQTPTENGVRYLIEKASIDRFIADAVSQAPTGHAKTPNEQFGSSQENTEISARSWSASDLGIYDHPYVKHLEIRNERLEDKNDRLQAEVKNVLEAANERLIELQKANAVAQSETLGTFLLEAERIRKSQDVDDPEPSPRPHPTSSGGGF